MREADLQQQRHIDIAALADVGEWTLKLRELWVAAERHEFGCVYQRP